MKILLDTHLLLWAAGFPEELSIEARRLIEDESNELFFSAASIWEIAIKARVCLQLLAKVYVCYSRPTYRDLFAVSRGCLLSHKIWTLRSGYRA